MPPELKEEAQSPNTNPDLLKMHFYLNTCKPRSCLRGLLVSQIVDNGEHGAQRRLVVQALAGSVRV